MRSTYRGNWAFDTNLLVYALDAKSPYFKKTYEIFSLIKQGSIKPLISTQNVAETVNVFKNFYQLPVGEVVQALDELISSFNFKIITPLPTTIPLFFNLLKKNKLKKAVYDLFLVATLIDNNQFQLFTANEGDFRNISKLIVVNPLRR